MPRLLVLLALFISLGSPAQNSPSPPTRPATEATQFDFFLGDWRLELTPKAKGLAAMIHGVPKLQGRWTVRKAWDGLGLMDEMRVFDAAGNPVALSQTLRLFDARTQRWQSHSLDVLRARLSSSSGRWQQGEMQLEGQGLSAEGKPRLTRSRFYEIGPKGFRWRQDVSDDNGATWEEGSLSIVATRAGTAN
ncbi:hypothetical protein HNQ51_000221 [Inhella inkyongensis]|uniref:DUF1579 domain-containing protein n=1 Tax=Inhella inkyongensis TaxID=392593 RepID=A0A840S0L1_9BURK|nr:hypothetical protein [Inhella inkyongensis]MBB5202928.1 hypothetical protein [Inhella inkyongensis]